MHSEMKKQTFVQGTFMLTAAALITRMLGFVGGIVTARLLGAEGIGLLMMAHPLLPLVITLTELGLPVAISKLVAEADAQGNPSKEKKILVVSLAVTGALSTVLTLLALFGSKMIASFFLTDQRAYYAMLAITPITPIVAVSSVLKGYFRGKQNMKPIAVSHVLEHVAQIVSVMALVELLLPYGIGYAAAGAMISSVIGEGAGLLCLISMFRLRKETNGPGRKLSGYIKEGKQTLFELLRIGLPTTGHGFIHSIYSAFQPLLVTKSLAIAGIGTALATKQFGMLAGYVFPLLFLPSFITESLSTALMPAISEAGAHRNGILMHRRIEQAMRIALVVGAPSTVILYVWAVPLTTVMYHAPEAGQLLKLLAPVFFLHYFDSPLHAVLLGLGKADTAMWNSLITTLFKAIAIFMLGTQFGIHGVVYGVGFGVCLLTLLNFFSVSGDIGFYLNIRIAFKVAFCVGVMVVCGYSSYSFMQNAGFPLSWSVLGAVGVCVAVYTAALAAANMFRRKDMRRFAFRRIVSARAGKHR